jgi:subtilisin family serine protease
MERVYYNGDRRRVVQEIENVVAILPDATTEGSAEARAAERFGEPAPSDATRGESQEREAFEQAGWVFVTPSAETREAMQRGQRVNGAAVIGKVFQQQSGRILVESKRLSVRLQDELGRDEAEDVLRTANVTIEAKLQFAPNLYTVSINDGRDVIDVAMQLHENDMVIFAEPEFVEHIGERYHPTDADYGDQWHLRNTGQNGGTAGADIDAEAAWDVTRGANVRVAVIDNGIDVNHADLAGAIVAGAGFYTDNGMGGANFNQGLAGFPNGNHGTFCSGMAIAREGNGTNGVGVAHQAGFIPIACLTDQLGTQATLARALTYAADPTQEVPGANPADGADVISCSLGPNGADWAMTATLQNAIDWVVANGRGGLGTPIFWAVTNGNFELQFDEVCSYANTIHVGRSTRDDDEDDCGFGPELDFLATGVDVSSTESGGGFGESTGTSFAAPTAAGVGALVLSVNPDLTWQQVRQTLRDTAEKIGGVTYDANGHNEDFGFGRVNANDAVNTAANRVELLTPTITFNDVPEDETTARAIVFDVQRAQVSTFQIISGPTANSGPGTFGTFPSDSATLPAGTAVLRQARLWLSHTGTNDGDVTTGTVRVRLVETGEEWEIPISGNTIGRITVGASLVLDQSGSMSAPSGLAAFPTRNDVLRFAAPVFVNVLQEGNGVGIVDFDSDAFERMPVQTAGPAGGGIDPVRLGALGIIGTHSPNPAGMTAIGDGVEAAKTQLDATGSTYDQKATIVFTDGHETESKYIADVAPLINDKVFAIGLGTADQIQPNALTALTNGTGGYLLLTGNVGNDDLFKLSKYFLQVLAGVTNHDIVLDPEGYLQPGQKIRIPFRLNEADISTDVILLSDWPAHAFLFSVETPAGDIIEPSNVTMLGGEYIVGQGVSYYRLTLPVAVGAGAHSGKWHAVMEINPRYYKYDGPLTHGNASSNNKIPANGLRYSLSVQSYSGIRLQGGVQQTSNVPGANVTVRAVLSEYGIPVGDNRSSLMAELDRPDGTGTVLTLNETEPGVYEASFIASQQGVYPMRILAKGISLRGRPFTREHLLTAATWKGGDQPPPTGDGDGGGRPGSSDWCKILHCLLGGKVISKEALERFKKAGIDLEALQKCLCAKGRK